MATTERNGQPSMEEILASIRRIIADEPPGVSPPINLSAKTETQAGPASLEEAQDFELPSMFRHRRSTAPSGQQPLFGRLTDAIRNASQAVSSHSETQGKANSSSAAKPDNAAIGSLKQRTTDTFGVRPQQQQELSSLQTRPRPEANGLGLHAPLGVEGAQQPLGQPGAGAFGPGAASGYNGPFPLSASAPPKPDKATGSVELPRVMAPFRDVRMSSMGSTTAAAPVNPSPQVQAGTNFSSVAARQVNFPASTPAAGTFGQNAPNLASTNTTAGFGGNSAPTAQPPSFNAAPQLATPPPLPEDAHQGPMSVEDATADLLRPMLRQWLSENMPRMVEKALHIEVAASVRPGRKPDQS